MAGRIRMRLLEIVVETAEAGGVSPAAKRLKLSPAAVSMSISRLEELLGVKLFVANRNELTMHGEALIAKIRYNVRLMQELRARLEADTMAALQAS